MGAEWVLCPLKMVWESIKTIGCNKLVFATIMAATSVPLSALTLYEARTTHDLAAHIHRLESLGRHVPTRFEARHIYLMAVLSLGLVVSVAEERFGWDAIRIGHGIMAGRRVCAWLLSGMFVAVSGLIRWKVDAVAAEGETGIKEKAIVIVSYAFVVIWSYAIMTAFYSHCRKRHPIKEPLPDHNPDQHLQLVSL
ncbi:hypothetical protein AHAS_Ahas01G0217500 [Arachis hypogaea]